MKRWAFGLFFVVLATPAFAAAQATPKPRCAITVTPAAINLGDSVTLKWEAANVTGGTITGISGGVGLKGSVNLIPSKSTRYVGFFNGVYGTASCEGIVVVYDGGTPGPVSDAAVLAPPPNLPPPPKINDTPTTVSAPAAKPAPDVPLSQGTGSGLIPCSGLDCQLCHLAALGQNIVNFLLGLSIPIAAAMFAYAGVLFFIYGSGIDKISQARKIFTTVGIGFLFIIGAWLGVQTILKAVLKDDVYRGWNTIQCLPSGARPMNRTLGDLLGGLPVLNTLVSGGNAVSGSGTSGATGSDLDNRKLAKDGGVETVSTGNCADKKNPNCTSLDGVDPNVIVGVTQINKQLDSRIVISGGTEEGVHLSAAQNQGRSVDIQYADPAKNSDPASIQKLIEAAQSRGECIVWEVPRGTNCPVGVKPCISPVNSTGTHGSYYPNPADGKACSQ